MSGEEAEQTKKWFLRILDAYASTGKDGARVGTALEQSLIRKPWF